MLLHWCTLEPSGSSNLAAVRFNSPVRIKTIRVYPTGSRPFSKADIIAQTEPNSFYFDVFLNAQPSPLLTTKLKHPNALIPSRLAFVGDQLEYAADMGPEYATRLMVVQGEFERLSLAIYGDVVSEMAPPPPTYEPRMLSTFEPVPLNRALDPSNFLDPTSVAGYLLGLLSEGPPLPVVIRLMFCLKPSNEDWDDPQFPFLPSGLEDDDIMEFDMEKVFTLTSRPVSDNVSVEVLRRFAEMVADTIDAKDSSQAYHIAGILRHAAAQHPDMSRLLLENISLDEIFDSRNLDESTLLRLLDAAANPRIARALSDDWFTELLTSIQTDFSEERDRRDAARRLHSRIRGWRVLEDALLNTQANFSEAVMMIEDIGREEYSFGVWLGAMVTHDDILRKFAGNAILPFPLPHPPLLLEPSRASASHDEFIAFLRAYIGVASVLAVYAWADSLPNVGCRERALSILRLWQGVNGYREIVNHLCLLRQITYRLECILDNSTPSKSGNAAEDILLGLAKEPTSMLRPDFAKAVVSLQAPLSRISQEQRLALREMAYVAEDGLSGALEELMRDLEQPITLDRLRVLRIAHAVLKEKIDEGEQGEWEVMQSLWQVGSHGLLSRLVEVFLVVSEGVQDHFALQPPPHKSQALVAQRFLLSGDILRLIVRLVPLYPLPPRLLSSLTAQVADLFVYTDAADMLYSQSSPACTAAEATRQTCIDVVHTLCGLDDDIESSPIAAEVVLRTLLQRGLSGAKGDPAFQLLQVFCLIDHLLPMSTPDASHGRQSQWPSRVLPNVLPELWALFSSLDTENKVHFTKRLVNLDDGGLGVGEWVLSRELQQLLDTLQALMHSENPQAVALGQYQISSTLRYLEDLLGPTSSASAWCLSAIATEAEISSSLAKALMLLLDLHLTSSGLLPITRRIASGAPAYPSALRLAVVLSILRSGQCLETSFADFESIFEHAAAITRILAPEELDLQRLSAEVGATLSFLAESRNLVSVDGLTPETAEAILYLAGLSGSTSGAYLLNISVPLDMWGELCDRLHDVLPEIRWGTLESVRHQARISLNTSDPHSYLSETVEISMDELGSILSPPPPAPSTPVMKPVGHAADVLALATVSPTALLRSPLAVTGLTKTYVANDFRQLRSTPSARQNTSRLPSMHVDDFQLSTSPPGTALSSPVANMFPADVHQPLSPAFPMS